MVLLHAGSWRSTIACEQLAVNHCNKIAQQFQVDSQTFCHNFAYLSSTTVLAAAFRSRQAWPTCHRRPLQPRYCPTPHRAQCGVAPRPRPK